jgi:hypothetical protein
MESRNYEEGGDYQQQPNQEEEEFKGPAPDFDKINLEKQYVPSIYENENMDFKVVKPQLHGSHIVYHV